MPAGHQRQGAKRSEKERRDQTFPKSAQRRKMNQRHDLCWAGLSLSIPPVLAIFAGNQLLHSPLFQNGTLILDQIISGVSSEFGRYGSRDLACLKPALTKLRYSWQGG